MGFNSAFKGLIQETALSDIFMYQCLGLDLLGGSVDVMCPIVNVKVLRMVYFAHFYSHIYGIVFWFSSSSMRNVFVIQKRAFTIMLRLGPRSSCREGFKKLSMLTVACLYIYALIFFAVKNLNIYQTNSWYEYRAVK
jgi:hypothetical protein